MHKFFLNYNSLTERYELSRNKTILISNKAVAQAENTLLPEIRSSLQQLYELISQIKESEKNENILKELDEIELLSSNLFYSLFSSPLELRRADDNATSLVPLYQKAITIASNLEKMINIPEYNRLIILIKNNLQNILNSISASKALEEETLRKENEKLKQEKALLEQEKAMLEKEKMEEKQE